MASAKKSTGKLVQTKQGDGYTLNTDPLVNGKVCVYISKTGQKMLCDPKNIKVLGYYD